MWPVGVKKKTKKEKKQRYDISRMCLNHMRWATTIKFGKWGGVADVINRAKCHANRYIGFGFLKGRKLPPNPWRTLISVEVFSFDAPVMMSFTSYVSLDVWSHVMLMSIFHHSLERLCCLYSSCCSLVVLCCYRMILISFLILYAPLMQINNNNNNVIKLHVRKLSKILLACILQCGKYFFRIIFRHIISIW